jgi:hypothetical protein
MSRGRESSARPLRVTTCTARPAAIGQPLRRSDPPPPVAVRSSDRRSSPGARVPTDIPRLLRKDRARRWRVRPAGAQNPSRSLSESPVLSRLTGLGRAGCRERPWPGATRPAILPRPARRRQPAGSRSPGSTRTAAPRGLGARWPAPTQSSRRTLCSRSRRRSLISASTARSRRRARARLPPARLEIRIVTCSCGSKMKWCLAAQIEQRIDGPWRRRREKAEVC